MLFFLASLCRTGPQEGTMKSPGGRGQRARRARKEAPEGGKRPQDTQIPLGRDKRRTAPKEACRRRDKRAGHARKPRRGAKDHRTRKYPSGGTKDAQHPRKRVAGADKARRTRQGLPVRKLRARTRPLRRRNSHAGSAAGPSFVADRQCIVCAFPAAQRPRQI